MIPFPQVLCISLKSAAQKIKLFLAVITPKQLIRLLYPPKQRAISKSGLQHIPLDIFEIENDKNNELITKLNTQRRMVQDICDLINE